MCVCACVCAHIKHNFIFENPGLPGFRTCPSRVLFFSSSPKDSFSLLLERGREREKHRCEREALSACLPHLPRPGIRDQTCNLGMCLDQESNLQPFGSRTKFQSTEPHWPGGEWFCICFCWVPQWDHGASTHFSAFSRFGGS